MAAGVVTGALKEAGDLLGWWPGELSLRDLGADAMGVALAAAAAVAWEAARPASAWRRQQRGEELA